MKKIITISREYGSGGRLIGKKLAEALGYPFYDKELIDLSAQESGLATDIIEKNEQNISTAWLFNVMLDSSVAIGTVGSTQDSKNQTPPLADQIFNAQRNVILRLAKEKPCVIVGRCSDYILSSSNEIDKNDLLNIFIYADLEFRINRAIKAYNVSSTEAKKIINQIDKRRANHYNTFTENLWGERFCYDVLINSALLDIDGTAKILADIARN